LIALEDKKIQRRFLFVNSIRISVLSALIFIAFFLLLFDVQFPALPIMISLGAAFIISLFHFSLIKRIPYRPAIYFQLMVDITLITILVYFSEAYRSPFYFLYMLPITISALFLGRRDTVYIASFSFIIFGTLSNLIYLKVIPFYPGNTEIEITLGSFIYNLTMSFIAFSTIAVLSSYYFDKIRTANAELKHVQDNLRDMILLNSTVMEKMENGFLTSDSNGSIISYNEKAKAMLDLTGSSNIFDLLFAKFDSKEIKKISQSNSKNYFEIENSHLTFGVSVSIIENIYSYDKLFVFIITDLTEKRAIEEELKKKEHMALIGEMSAGIAHEIRNPLASISGSVQFLHQSLELKNDEYKNLMQIIVKESQRLSHSIEDFLEFTRITPPQKADFDISTLIDEVTDLIAVNHKEIKWIKKYTPGSMIHADMKKMKQLVWNLVNNAVKAVNNRGTIEINLYKKDEKTLLSITDDGIGMEKSEIAKIFNPFYSKFSSGIGLGMALVKRIIDEHDFKITVNSQKDVGTEVTICFKKE